jgi:hypothetical protein
MVSEERAAGRTFKNFQVSSRIVGRLAYPSIMGKNTAEPPDGGSLWVTRATGELALAETQTLGTPTTSRRRGTIEQGPPVRARQDERPRA